MASNPGQGYLTLVETSQTMLVSVNQNVFEMSGAASRRKS